MQKQYVKHLMHLKSSKYEEKVKQQLKNEVERRNELLERKVKIEKLTNSLMKSNVNLLKKRAEEVKFTKHQLIFNFFTINVFPMI